MPFVTLVLGCTVAVRLTPGRGCREQVEKMGLLTGSRLGAERTVDLDELEVCCTARLPA